jgi:hypothetical protein
MTDLVYEIIKHIVEHPLRSDKIHILRLIKNNCMIFRRLIELNKESIIAAVSYHREYPLQKFIRDMKNIDLDDQYEIMTRVLAYYLKMSHITRYINDILTRWQINPITPRIINEIKSNNLTNAKYIPDVFGSVYNLNTFHAGSIIYTIHELYNINNFEEEISRVLSALQSQIVEPLVVEGIRESPVYSESGGSLVVAEVRGTQDETHSESGESFQHWPELNHRDQLLLQRQYLQLEFARVLSEVEVIETHLQHMENQI